MNQFHVGQKVVCIDSVVGFEQFIEVKEGEFYEIEWIGPFEHYIHGSYIGVRLKGVDRESARSLVTKTRLLQHGAFVRSWKISCQLCADCLLAGL